MQCTHVVHMLYSAVPSPVQDVVQASHTHSGIDFKVQTQLAGKLLFSVEKSICENLILKF